MINELVRRRALLIAGGVLLLLLVSTGDFLLTKQQATSGIIKATMIIVGNAWLFLGGQVILDEIEKINFKIKELERELGKREQDSE